MIHGDLAQLVIVCRGDNHTTNLNVMCRLLTREKYITSTNYKGLPLQIYAAYVSLQYISMDVISALDPIKILTGGMLLTCAWKEKEAHNAITNSNSNRSSTAM